MPSVLKAILEELPKADQQTMMTVCTDLHRHAAARRYRSVGISLPFDVFGEVIDDEVLVLLTIQSLLRPRTWGSSGRKYNYAQLIVERGTD